MTTENEGLAMGPQAGRFGGSGEVGGGQALVRGFFGAGHGRSEAGGCAGPVTRWLPDAGHGSARVVCGAGRAFGAVVSDAGLAYTATAIFKFQVN
jgi:hypothetical protein